MVIRSVQRFIGFSSSRHTLFLLISHSANQGSRIKDQGSRSSRIKKEMVRAPCCKEEGIKKGAWTREEDQQLIAYIQLHGEGGWRTLPDKAGLKRCGKSCRLRWANYLRPDIKRGEFTPKEDDTIIKLHALKGNKWAAIATCLAGRTDNEIKNYWNTNLKKRLKQKGIDPITHKPITLTGLKPNKHKPVTTSGSAKLLNRVASKYAVNLNRNLLTGLITGNSNVPDKIAEKSVSMDTTSTLSGFSDDIIELFSKEEISDMYTNVDSFGIMEEFKDILSYDGAGVMNDSPELSLNDDKIELLETWDDGGIMDFEKFMRSLDSKVEAFV